MRAGESIDKAVTEEGASTDITVLGGKSGHWPDK